MGKDVYQIPDAWDTIIFGYRDVGKMPFVEDSSEALPQTSVAITLRAMSRSSSYSDCEISPATFDLSRGTRWPY